MQNTHPRGQLPPINFAALADALLARAESLVPMWLPGGKLANGEYLVHSVWRSEKTASLSVRVSGERAGRWGDFGGDHKGGDLISLYAAIHGLDNGQAALQLARELGLERIAGVQPLRQEGGAPGAAVSPPPPPPVEPKPARAPAMDEGWRTCMPVPAHAPAATFKHQYRTAGDITHTAKYQMDGHLLGYVVRFKTSDGGKETLPYTWCTSAVDGASRWHWKTWDEPRPLYLPGGLSPAQCVRDGGALPTVVLVEGERKADMLHALLQAGAPGVYLVASWPGGCKAWTKALWDWLAGCTVLLWPDCDGKRELLTKKEREAAPETLARAVLQQAKPLLPAHKQPGVAAMLGIGALLRDKHSCTVQMLAIPEPGAVSDGWDCADAIETDGWDFARVLALFGTGAPLPPSADSEGRAGPPGAHAGPSGAAAGGGGGKDGGDGKKIEGPGDPEDGDDGDSGDGADGEYIGGKLVPRWLAPYYDPVKKRWHTSRKLVIAALLKDPALNGVLGFNELSNNIDARALWPWPHAKVGPVTGSADLLLGDYLTRTYGLPSIARAALVEAIETVAHGRRFHPVREYLQRLEWDGVERRNKWLIYAIGETPETLKNPALVEYLTLVGRYWLLGMVNRVMEPGCKFDYCPVLEGPGGLGKSTMVEVLASKDFFSDTHFDVSRGKDGQEQVQGLWIYEIAELANFGKAEIGLIKAFISGKVDRYRPSYGRTVEAYARQCVLVGTTNESTYLRDRTGNRRFWPIPVKQRIRIGWLTKMRDQLLAEAYAMYLQGEPFTPTPADEARLFVPMQESRLVETAVTSELMNLLTREPTASESGQRVNNLTDFVTLAQLALALGVDAAKSNAGLESQIRAWMEHEGWERIKRQMNGVRSWGYVRPKDWPPMDAEPLAGPDGASAGIERDDDDAPF